MVDFLTRTAKDETAGLAVTYTIVCTDDLCPCDPRYDKVYSLLVVGYCGGEAQETTFVYDITRTYERAGEIAELLCRNRVTPCTVYEVLDDVL